VDQQHDRARRAVMYVRVGGAQHDSYAVGLQRRECERIAGRYGVTIVREYVDQGKPARLEQQTELQRLLADLGQLQDAAYVVVWDYARLGSDFKSLDDIIRRIQDCGAEVATITGVETAERLTRTSLLAQVAEWANHSVGNDDTSTTDEPLAKESELSAAVHLIRSGQLNTSQHEALATLMSIAGNATLPTPVAAAVFNVVEECTRPRQADSTTNA
jgi:Resolvase, N terminal domain